MTSDQIYLHEGVGDRFGSPGHHTPTGDAPAKVVFANRPLKRRPAGECRIEMEVTPLASEPNLGWGGSTVSVVSSWCTPGENTVLRGSKYVPCHCLSHPGHPQCRFGAWPGGLPHPWIGAPCGVQAISEAESACDGVVNGKVGANEGNGSLPSFHTPLTPYGTPG